MASTRGKKMVVENGYKYVLSKRIFICLKNKYLRLIIILTNVCY